MDNGWTWWILLPNSHMFICLTEGGYLPSTPPPLLSSPYCEQMLDTGHLVPTVWKTGDGQSHQRASSQLTVMLGPAVIRDTPRESCLVLRWHFLCYHCLRFSVHVVQGLTKNRCLINGGSQHPSYWPFAEVMKRQYLTCTGWACRENIFGIIWQKLLVYFHCHSLSSNWRFS